MVLDQTSVMVLVVAFAASFMALTAIGMRQLRRAPVRMTQRTRQQLNSRLPRRWHV